MSVHQVYQLVTPISLGSLKTLLFVTFPEILSHLSLHFKDPSLLFSFVDISFLRGPMTLKYQSFVKDRFWVTIIKFVVPFVRLKFHLSHFSEMELDRQPCGSYLCAFIWGFVRVEMRESLTMGTKRSFLQRAVLNVLS